MRDGERGSSATHPDADDREEGRLDYVEAWADAERKQELERKREETRRRKEEEEAEAWKAFMKDERRQIKLRQNGQLAELLGKPLPGELPTTLEKLAENDEIQAKRGLIALMSGGTTTYKALEDLKPEDMPARIAANRLRTAWLKERGDEWLARGES